MSMPFIINMQNLKQLYQFKWNNLTYPNYDKYCMNNKYFDFKVKNVVGI